MQQRGGDVRERSDDGHPAASVGETAFGDVTLLGTSDNAHVQKDGIEYSIDDGATWLPGVTHVMVAYHRDPYVKLTQDGSIDLGRTLNEPYPVLNWVNPVTQQPGGERSEACATTIIFPRLGSNNYRCSQPCGHQTAHNEINQLRNCAKAPFGKMFDLAAFNDVIVKTGAVSPPIMAMVIDQYVDEAKREFDFVGLKTSKVVEPARFWLVSGKCGLSLGPPWSAVRL